MMDQFVIWSLHGVRYLCLRTNPASTFVQTLKRI